MLLLYRFHFLDVCRHLKLKISTFNFQSCIWLFFCSTSDDPRNFPHLESGYQASQNRLRMFDIEEMGPNMAMDQLVSSLKTEVCQWTPWRIVLLVFFSSLNLVASPSSDIWHCFFISMREIFQQNGGGGSLSFFFCRNS